MTFKEGGCKGKSDDYPNIVIRADLIKECALSNKYKFLYPWGKELRVTDERGEMGRHLHLPPTIHLVYGLYTCYIFPLWAVGMVFEIAIRLFLPRSI